VLTLILH
jgi:hypothetical protein